jgi:hypothetical protein
MRLFQVFLVLIPLLSHSAVFAQGYLALGGISGGGGVDGVAEIVGFDGGTPLVRCPDLNIYRWDTARPFVFGRDPSTALQLFCLEVQTPL